MKNEIALRAALLWGGLHMPAQAAAQPAVPGCPYMGAPADSLVMQGDRHIPNLVMWPRSFTPAYSGCVYLWFEKRLYSIARLNHGKVMDGVIEDAVEGVSDDTDLPPMVYCKASDPSAESDCEEFKKLWTEEFPGMVGEINKRSEAVPAAARDRSRN